MTDILTSANLNRKIGSITQEQYNEFKEFHWTVYILQDKRYGQAFCEHFDIPSITTLYYFKDKNIAERWIRDNYGLT
jgi:hypothetical protein